MSNKKATKRALLTSILAICLCLVMLIGSTFAWFTDTASTGVNKIVAGNLDVALEMQQKDADGNLKWVSAEGQILKWKQASTAAAGDEAEANPNNSFTLVDSTQIFWEPGCTYQLQPIRVINNGNLALKYKIAITGITGDKGLNRVIKWTVNDQDIDTTEKKLAVGSDPVVLTIKGHMDEKAGNEYMNMHIDGIGITVYATQDTVEFDSIDNWYDKNADYPLESVSTISEAVMTKNTEGNYTYTNTDNTVTVNVPADAADTGTAPKVSIARTEANGSASAAIKADGKDAIAYDIKIEPLKADNTEKITISFPLGKNLTGVKVYHEGAMMPESDFNYDPNTGIVTIRTASFSVYTFAYDTPIALSKDEASYTLAEFNALTEIPEDIKTVYLNIGDVSLKDGSVVIGNDNIRDKYERNITAEEPYGISYTDKDGIDLIIDGGTIKDGPAVDNSVANKIAFKIPDKSTVTFKNVKIEGFFGLSGATSDNPYGTVMPHKIAGVTFDSCTFDALWFQNGSFGTSQITIKDSTFNKYENSKSSSNTNPMWFKNIGQTTKVGDKTWELGTNIRIDNCVFNTNRPVKVVEETVTGQTVSITNCTFNMESDTENKNAAIMFSQTNNGSTGGVGSLGNVVVSGNKVNGGVALLAFYSDTKITMTEGATFTVSNNTLGTGVKTSVVWKSATEFTPNFGFAE